MTKFNRRNILKATAISGSGLAALAYSPKPTLAASDWTVNSPSGIGNSSGELSSLEIPASGFSFSLDYSGLGTRSHSIDFELEAKLSTNSSFETVFSESFEVSGESGTVTESKLSTSFPVDLLANTSMSASDFAEPNAGDTETTTVDLRVSFNWSEGEYSASDSATDSFDVSVTNTGPVIIDDFEDGDVSEYTEYSQNYTHFEVQSSPTYNGSYSLYLKASSWDRILLESTSGLPAYPEPGDTIVAYLLIADSNGGDHQLRFGGSGRNNCYALSMSARSQEVKILRHDSGSSTTLSSTSWSANANMWYKLEIGWSTNGDIDVTVYDASNNSTVLTLQATDGTYSSGSHISFENNDNNEYSEAWWDYVQKA